MCISVAQASIMRQLREWIARDILLVLRVSHAVTLQARHVICKMIDFAFIRCVIYPLTILTFNISLHFLYHTKTILA